MVVKNMRGSRLWEYAGRVPPLHGKVEQASPKQEKSICGGPTQLNECMGNTGERANGSKEREEESIHIDEHECAASPGQ